jgi:transposase
MRAKCISLEIRQICFKNLQNLSCHLLKKLDTIFAKKEKKMEKLNNENKETIYVSESYEQLDKDFKYEVCFRRWLVSEIEHKKLTVSEALSRFNFSKKSGFKLIRDWRKKYGSEMVLSLPEMTAEEKQNLSKLEQQNKALEKALEAAKMKNIALNMLIDVAEEKLKISIRKKSGAKQ